MVGLGNRDAPPVDLDAQLAAAIRDVWSREASREIIRLLRDGIRILMYRPPELDALDACIREESVKLQQALYELQESLHALRQEIRKSRGRGDGAPIS